jgi:FAD/FMN-containing dehydrogenase
MNFLEWGESGGRTRQGFSPESYRRLQALKAQYDPENLFSQGFDFSAG